MLDLWLQPVDEATVRWAQAQSSVLDEQETQRWRRYQSDETQTLFLVAHVVTRNVLSHYGDRSPESWRFATSANGRPEIIGGPAAMRFNISHTEGMVAVLVHSKADCGVDVEHPWRSMDLRSVSRRVFTGAEQAAIFSQLSTSQADRFFQLWTLKEAFIKAKGKGFALPLKQFSFAVLDEQHGGDQGDAGPRIEFDCDPAIASAPDQWQFFTHRPESGHIVSIAAHRGSGDVATPLVTRQLDLVATPGEK